MYVCLRSPRFFRFRFRNSEIHISCRFVPRRARVAVFFLVKARPRRRTEVRASSHGGARLGWPAGGDRAPSRPRAVSVTMSQCCVCMESTGEKSVVRARRTDGEIRDASRPLELVPPRSALLLISGNEHRRTEHRRTVARRDAKSRHARNANARHNVDAKAPRTAI